MCVNIFFLIFLFTNNHLFLAVETIKCLTKHKAKDGSNDTSVDCAKTNKTQCYSKVEFKKVANQSDDTITKAVRKCASNGECRNNCTVSGDDTECIYCCATGDNCNNQMKVTDFKTKDPASDAQKIGSFVLVLLSAVQISLALTL